MSLGFDSASGSPNIDALLEQFSHFGVQLGLERIQRLLADLGNPQQQVRIIHVAGSNGKGSVCAYLSSVLMEAGYRVGRYTSPHLVSWNERICLNETPISSADLHQLLLQVIAAIRESEETPTQFEVITAAAWLYFAQQQVDIAVMEVGLGGRLDATNVCDRPLVSVITSLSREHWQRLGPTLADISREKAGILKPNCPAVIAPLPPEAEPVIKQRLAEL
ncbi:MAG: bifunctional folylpolyglutamate synthase/dihydrofolate synthase, partial [Leptolyngbyaceae cyanobacterium RM2_2_4]|nr:bifunctional folylpolyglutamate synthase/dihydrofolate synthase [Leptolyngbyaceae cyanobacterium RM2_2_4]